MTPEDFRSIIREEIAASEQRIVTATTANLSDLRNEFNLRIDNLEGRFTDVDRRLDKLTESLRQVEHRMATLNKWSDSFDTSQAALSHKYGELLRTLALLTARVAALESKQPGQQQ